MSHSELKQAKDAETGKSGWKGLCKLGATTVFIASLIPPAEIAINYQPGVADLSQRTVTVLDWFALFQNHWFIGLRNLGLLNIFGAVLLAPTIFAIYTALRRDDEACVTFGTILFFVGMAVYLANSRAFPMLSLSSQYAAATTDAQRSLFLAAGQAMLSEGQARAGIPLIEFACLAISAVMLRGNVFGKWTAYAGIIGNMLLLGVEVIIAIEQRLPGVGMVIAASGGLLIMTWDVLVGRRLLQLGRL
jgi:Domain of unknown function (DUF4386)